MKKVYNTMKKFTLAFVVAALGIFSYMYKGGWGEGGGEGGGLSPDVVGAGGPGGKKQKPMTAMKKVYNVMKKFTYAFVALALAIYAYM
jgi:hypothetical protein